MEENIIITGRDLEDLNNPVFIGIFNKEFSIKDKFYLARILDKIQNEARVYFAKKQELIQKYVKKYTFDNKKINKGGDVIAEHKKGDIMMKGESFYFGENLFAFTDDLNKLMDVEIDIGIRKRKIDMDEWPDLTPYEIKSMIPYIIIDEGDEL